MKFGKLLQSRAEELKSTGLTEHFLRYKALKKTLKQISKEEDQQTEAQNGDAAADDHPEIGHAFQSLEHASDKLEPQHNSSSSQEGKSLTDAERSFIDTLKQDLQQFNDFFIEKEEECIIRTQVLEEQLANAQPGTSMSKLRSAFVDLHGEMVLLLHWSMLNYAAVVKILKKHDKNSGVVLRAPFLASVLKQPFYSTERITELVKDVEQDLQKLLGEEQESESKDAAHEEGAEEKKPKEDLSKAAPLLKRTHAALEMWKEMGDKASTPSTVAPSGKAAKTGAQQTPGARLADSAEPSKAPPAAEVCAK